MYKNATKSKGRYSPAYFFFFFLRDFSYYRMMLFGLKLLYIIAVITLVKGPTTKEVALESK